MQLLCFAHLGEAQTFIKSLKLKMLEHHFYLGPKQAVLITGEGIDNTFTRLGYYLGKYNFTQIINSGIAGALNKKLDLNSIYSIRTIYAHNGNECKFHSYSSDTNTGVDCISCDQRVLTNELADLLFHHANIVDRELWAIAKIAQEFKIPWMSYKFISDYAGEQTACFDIKSRAKQYSDELYKYFCENLFMAIPPGTERKFELPFHASFTQQKRIYNLVQLLNKQDQENLLDNLIEQSKVENLDTKDKVKAQKFIHFLEHKITPVKEIINNEIHKATKPLTDIGTQVQLDPKLENKKIILKTEINSETNIEKLIIALHEFNYKRIEQIWDGKLDV